MQARFIQTWQYSAACLHAFFISGVAGCHGGGPLFDNKPIDIGDALIIPTSYCCKTNDQPLARKDVNISPRNETEN